MLKCFKNSILNNLKNQSLIKKKNMLTSMTAKTFIFF